MIESFKRPPGALRWLPRQRFRLSAAGHEARLARQRSLTLSRASDEGRPALDRTELEWATPLGVLPQDGICLEELAGGARSVAQLAESLADCGATKPEVQATIDRLFKAGLLEPEQRPSTPLR